MDDAQLARMRNKTRKVRDAAFDVGVENTILKGKIMERDTTIGTVRCERDELRDQVRRLKWRIAVLTWVVAPAVGVTLGCVLFVGKFRGWW